MADYRRVFDQLDESIPDRAHAVIRRDLTAAVQAGVRSAKRNVPVKTGRLQRSLRAYVGGFRGVIYSDLIYAPLRERESTRPYFVRKGWITAVRLLRGRGYTGAEFIRPEPLSRAARSARASERAVLAPRDPRGRFVSGSSRSAAGGRQTRIF